MPATDDTYTIASGADLWAGRDPSWLQYISAPETADDTGGGPSGSWAWFGGTWDISDAPYYDDHGITMYWGYSRTTPVPASMRPLVHHHGSSAGTGAGMQTLFAPPFASRGQIEVRNPDAEAYNAAWRESWGFDESGTPFPSRRVATSLDFLRYRYGSAIDFDAGGLILKGGSMGGGGALFSAMLLPAYWRERVAYVTVSIGGLLPRRHAGFYGSLWPADSGAGAAYWDSVDFEIQALTDPILRGLHIRHRFSSDDGFWSDSPLYFVNFCEAQKIAHSASWVENGHNVGEAGVATMHSEFFYTDDANCDVTLDRAHPCLTNSSGNHPTNSTDRLNLATYPRGHYNLGITWHHGNIVDSASEIIFPIKYVRRTSIGGGIPDQPSSITVDVTPRRPRNFSLTNGETIYWTFDGGAQSGSGTVDGDTITAAGIALTSGDDYKQLRFYK